MKLHACVLSAVAALSAAGAVEPLVDAESRWDEKGYWRPNNDEAKVAPYTLESPIEFADGSRLECPADWPLRRAEILDIFAKKIYGQEPPPPKTLKIDLLSEKVTTAGYAIRRIFRMSFSEDGSGPAITWGLWIPRHARGKVPVVVWLNYRGIHELDGDSDVPVCKGWARNRPQYHVVNHQASEKTRGKQYDQNAATVLPMQTILARGYAVLSASYTDVSPDPDGFGRDGVDQYSFATTNGVFKLWGSRDEGRTDNITSLGAWAWALSRGLDLASQQKEIDSKRSVVTGCSRLGKAAFLAAARDPRFAVCVPNQCGGGGICLAKRDFGENVSTENAMFTHWYCKAYRQYSANPAKLMDFDMHLLLAAIAPRRVLIEGFGPNDWMDTKGEFLAARAASPAWEFLGVPGLPRVTFPEYYDESAIGPYLGYVRRTEDHGISGYDWNWTLNFADAAWKSPYEIQRRIVSPVWNRQFPPQRRKVRAARGKTFDLLLVGDSITWNWENTPSGRAVYGELTNLCSVLNIGICGDKVEDMDWGCRNGQLDGYKARRVMVFAGTNNVGSDAPEEICAKIGRLLDTIVEKQPGAKIILMAPLPIGNSPDNRRRPRCAELKTLLKSLADRRGCAWLDFEGKMLEPDGSVPAERRPDGVHFAEYGYRCWLDALKKEIVNGD